MKILKKNCLLGIRSANIPISGPIIQEKASKISESLGLVDFKASSGWLHRLKIRHGIGRGAFCVNSIKFQNLMRMNGLHTLKCKKRVCS